MNAPVRHQAPTQSEIEDLAQDFAECCRIQVWFVNEGRISKQRAVDSLQQLVETLKVPDEDRDAAQAIMAEAFAPIEQQPCEHCGLTIDRHRRVDTDDGSDFFCSDLEPEEMPLPADYAERIVQLWELNDPRDRWRHTGEHPPTSAVIDQHGARAPYRTPQSTIDAFWYVPAEHLAGWLAEHPQDAPHLHKLWIEKCSQTTK